MKDQITRREFVSGLVGGSALAAMASHDTFGLSLSAHRSPLPAPDLAAWLDTHPKVRDSIYWQTPPAINVSLGGGSYAGWSSTRKQALNAAFQAAWDQTATNLADPPPNVIQVGDDDFYFTAIKENYAWPLYLSYVAQSLAVEIGQRVPWSITGYSSENLGVLLDSREMFTWSPKYAAYQIDHSRSGSALPAPADISFALVKAGGKILPSRNGSAFVMFEDRKTTILKLFDWCRLNFWHTPVNQGGKSGQAVWQYRGFPPVSRMISGTVSANDKTGASKHWTSGCNCTTGFLRAVLRTANIPVTFTSAGGHTLPYFPTEGKHLSHGDDLYGKTSRVDPLMKKMSYLSAELLIDESKYNSWFGSGVSEQTKLNNVGRQGTELLVKYPTTFVLRMYCDDIKANLSHANGNVFGYFKYLYSLPQLEATGIYQMLDQQLKIYPCNIVPYL